MKQALMPRWLHNRTHKITPTLTSGYKDELNWFGAVELCRRMVTVVLIVALPGNEVCVSTPPNSSRVQGNLFASIMHEPVYEHVKTLILVVL